MIPLEPMLSQLNIDGKVLRATAKGGKKKSGLCIVSAWAGEHRLILGQEKVASKSNEKTAIPDLLQTLELSNTLVSIDAIACEQSNAELIVEKKGHYLLALKKNQGLLYDQVTQRTRECNKPNHNYLSMSILTLVVVVSKPVVVTLKVSWISMMIYAPGLRVKA